MWVYCFLISIISNHLTRWWDVGLSRKCVILSSEVTQSCPTLCDLMDCILPGSSIHGIFQARVLEWVAIFFSRESSWPRDQTQVSHIAGRCFTVFATKEAQILEWVAYPFSRSSSQPRNGTRVSCTAGGFLFFFFFTNWAVREALSKFLINCEYRIMIFKGSRAMFIFLWWPTKIFKNFC